MTVLVANNAVSTLAASITGASGTLTVQTGHGARFPNPGVDEYFILTVQEGSAHEIMRCTARNDDILTITRAQEGTSAQTFGEDSDVSMRITAGVLEAVQAEAAAAVVTAEAAQAAAEAAQEDAETAQAAADAASLSRLPLAGGTLTGNLLVSKANPQIILNKLANGQQSALVGYSGGVTRWVLDLANFVAETGSNAGSNFEIGRYNDAGTYIDSPLLMNRATGGVIVGNGGLAVGTGGAEVAGVLSCRTSFTVQTATFGYFKALIGDTTYPGYIEFRTPAGVRTGYIGFGRSYGGVEQNDMVAENSRGWYMGGAFTFGNTPNFDSGSVSIRKDAASLATLYFRTDADAERAIIWSGTDGSLNFRTNGGSGPVFSLSPTLGIVSPAVNASSDSGSPAAIRARNVSGSGNSNVAAIAFECQGVCETKLSLRADGVMGLGGGSFSSYRWYVDMTNGNMTAVGDITAGGIITGANFVTASDRRLKDDIHTILDPLGIVRALSGVEFIWNDKSKMVSGRAGQRDVGLLADEVERVLPHAVFEAPPDPDTGDVFKTVAYSKLVPVLIEAIKTLEARVKELEAR